LPRQSMILVIGANGGQGMHVVDQLLERGFRVRCTVRNAEKAISTGKYFEEKYGVGRYMPVVIPDMVHKGAFDLAIRGCSGVVHSASVMTYSTDPHEVVSPTIAGVLNALESAGKESGVKRFVCCSAPAATVSDTLGTINEVTGESWDIAAFEKAWNTAPPY
ncbi:NAD(P)-binding protein, partial [Teratosphaeria nubilosa]